MLIYHLNRSASHLSSIEEEFTSSYRPPQPIPILAPNLGTGSAKRGLLIAKGYYFLFFGAIGCFVPFFNLYLAQRGLTGIQIGWLGSIPPLVALAANPIWGAVADRWQIHRLVLALCALLAGIVALLFLGGGDFWVLLGLVTALAFFRTPIISIVDSTAMELVKQTGSHYGRQRVWGTVGFVLATWGLGQLLTPANLPLIFWLHAGGLGLGCAGLSFLLPGENTPQQVGIGHGLRALMGRPDYLTFLIAMTLMGMAIASNAGFLGLHILALGGTERQVGLAWAANAVMEIPIMYFGGRWFARYSYGQLLLTGYLGFMLVWLLVALVSTPTLIIAVLPGLGICYGFFWVAAVGYASSAAPPGLSATAQALMGAAMSGLGWSLGSVAAGYLWDRTDGHMVFFFTAFVALLAALIFWWGQRSGKK